MLTPGLLPWLGVAGGIGALLRHLLVRAFTNPSEPGDGTRSRAGSGASDIERGNSALATTTYPLGTTVVNLVGAAAGGILLGVSVFGELSATDGGSALLTLLSVGLLGAFTTFSAWMTEVAGLLEDGRPTWALLHLLAMPGAGIFMAAATFWIALRL